MYLLNKWYTNCATVIKSNDVNFMHRTWIVLVKTIVLKMLDNMNICLMCWINDEIFTDVKVFRIPQILAQKWKLTAGKWFNRKLYWQRESETGSMVFVGKVKFLFRGFPTQIKTLHKNWKTCKVVFDGNDWNSRHGSLPRFRNWFSQQKLCVDNKNVDWMVVFFIVSFY